MLDAVFTVAGDDTVSEDNFEGVVLEHIRKDDFDYHGHQFPEPSSSQAPLLEPREAAARLNAIVQTKLSHFVHMSDSALLNNRRPARWIRYWAPGLLIFVRQCHNRP